MTTSVLTMVGGKIVHGEGRYAELAPPAPRAAADWLPPNHYPSYQHAERSAPMQTGAREIGAAHGAQLHPIIGNVCPCAMI
jgi:hypothetical protein